MIRNLEYQNFLDIVSGRKKDVDPPDLEIAATVREIGWWKQYQFRRAMRKARAGKATEVELIYLARHGYYYPNTPKEYIKKPKNGDLSDSVSDRKPLKHQVQPLQFYFDKMDRKIRR